MILVGSDLDSEDYHFYVVLMHDPPTHAYASILQMTHTQEIITHGILKIPKLEMKGWTGSYRGGVSLERKGGWVMIIKLLVLQVSKPGNQSQICRVLNLSTNIRIWEFQGTESIHATGYQIWQNRVLNL